MKRKQVLAFCLVLAVLAGTMTVILVSSHGSNVQDNDGNRSARSFPTLISNIFGRSGRTISIQSDGRKYSVKDIDAVSVVTGIPEGKSLPAVGDMETLLKLLKDRGILYDAAAFMEQNARNGANRAGSSMAGSATSPGMTVPSSAPVPDLAAPMQEAAPGAPAFSASADAGEDSYSRTNEQVAGVNEGDIVKTDGRFIYAMSPYDSRLRIIKADGADIRVVSTITYDDILGAEFYLIGNDRLVIIGSGYIPIVPLPARTDGSAGSAEAKIAPDYWWYPSNHTTLLVFDISDGAAPAELRRVSLDGWGVSTRVIGSVVYLVTNKQIWNIPFDQADSPLIMPYCRDTGTETDARPIGLDRIYYVPDANDSSYLLIGAVDVYSDEPFAPAAYLGASSSLYMCTEAMYIYSSRWEEAYIRDGMIDRWPSGGLKTDIMRFAISGTDVVYTGMGTVDGSPINQYSMDEYDGYFRIATTDWNTGTYVTVLDTADMRVTGRTEPLAPGEMMRSMRFMGAMGYVVTFQNTDPLFTIDLSNPFAPRMLGELKIPGFSQYLHPLANGFMLGLGRDTQEIYTRDSRGVETVIGFKDVGLKASLFDVSNPFDPKEVAVLALGEGWTEVSDNPRALMCDPSRDLYGFIIESWNDKSGQTKSALLLGLENGKLTVAAELNTCSDIQLYNSRLCFIGNSLYYVHSSGVIVFDYTSFERLSSIRF